MNIEKILNIYKHFQNEFINLRIDKKSIIQKITAESTLNTKF